MNLKPVLWDLRIFLKRSQICLLEHILIECDKNRDEQEKAGPKLTWPAFSCQLFSPCPIT